MQLVKRVGVIILSYDFIVLEEASYRQKCNGTQMATSIPVFEKPAGERGPCYLSSLKRLRARVLLTCTIQSDERGPHRHMQSDKARRQLFFENWYMY